MPYDDIRFSEWDDPDDDDSEIDEINDDYDYEPPHEYECRTCGKETTYVDDHGDCSRCRMVNAG